MSKKNKNSHTKRKQQNPISPKPKQINIKEVNEEIKETKPKTTENSKENTNENIHKNIKTFNRWFCIFAGVFILYLFIASNFIMFSNKNNEYIDAKSSVNYEIKYKTLPFAITDVQIYLDNERVGTNVFIPDGKHTIKLKMGLYETTKEVYTYNGFVKTTLDETEKTNLFRINQDIDNDGLYDYTEANLNTDVFEKDLTKEFLYTFTKDDVKIQATGCGNFTNISIENVESKFINNTNINVVNPVKITAPSFTDKTNKIKDCKIEFTIPPNITEEVVIYSFNSLNNQYETLDTRINNNIAATNISSNGIYGLALKSKLNEFDQKIEVAFVIDNSASLFSIEDYETITQIQYTGDKTLLEKDKENNRINLTKEIISKFNKHYNISISYFNKNSENILKMTDDLTASENILDNFMYSYTDFGKSKMYTGINNGIKTFTNNTDYKYLILIADGNNQSKDDITKTKIVQTIKDNNIKLIVLGVNNCNEDELKALCDEVDGSFYYLNDKNIKNQLCYELSINKYETIPLNIKEEQIEVFELANMNLKFDELTLFSSFYTKNENGISNNSFGVSLLNKLLITNQTVDLENIKIPTKPFRLDVQNYLSNVNLSNTKVELNNEYKDKLMQYNVNIQNIDNVYYQTLPLEKFEFADINDLIIDENEIENLNITKENKEAMQYIIKLQNSVKEVNNEEEINDIEYIKYNLNIKNPVLMTLYSNTNKNTILIYGLYQDKENPLKYYIEFIDPLDTTSSKIAILHNINIEGESKYIIEYQNYSKTKLNKTLNINNNEIK